MDRQTDGLIYLFIIEVAEQREGENILTHVRGSNRGI
jgi:hypothetical protein